MATITADSINLTANTGGNFGHHIFTNNSSKTHVTEYRPACAVKRSQIAGEHTQTHTWEKSLDWRQYPEASNVYIPNNYFAFDYVKQYDPQQQYISFENETDDADQIVTYLFDFADYYPTQVKTSLTVQFKVQISVGSSEITVSSGTASQLVNASTDQTISVTLSDWDFDSGLIPVKIQCNTERLAISEIQASISVTGSTRAFQDWYVDTAIATTSDTVSSDSRIIKDTRLEYSDVESTVSSTQAVVGASVVYGYLDNNRSSSVVTGSAQSTESKLTSNIPSYSVGTSAVFNADSAFTKIMAGYNYQTTPYFDNVAGDATLLEDTADRGFVSGFTCSVWFYHDGSTPTSGTQHIFQFADTSATTDKVRGLNLTVASNNISFVIDGVSGVAAVAPVNKLRTGWNNITFTAKPDVNFAHSNLQLYPAESNPSDGGTTIAYLNGVDITDSSIGGTYPNVFNNAVSAPTTSPTYINSPTLLVGCQYNHGTQTITSSDSQFPIYSVYYRDRYLDLTDQSLRNALYFYGVPPATEPPEPGFHSHTITEGSNTFTTIADESGPDLFLHVDSGTIKCYTSGYTRRQTLSSEWPTYVDFSNSIYPGSGYPYTWEDNPETKTVDSTSNVTIATNTAPRDDLQSQLIVKNTNDTVFSTDLNTVFGGSPTSLSSSDHDRYTADAETPIINYTVKQFGGFGPGALSNIDIQLDQVHPIQNTIEQPFAKIRYILAQALISSASLETSFGITADPGVIIDNSHEFDVAFVADTDPTVVIDSGTYQLDTAFSSTMFGGRQFLIDEQLDTAFTSTQTAQQLFGVPSIDIAVSWFNDTDSGIIIDNSQSVAFNFALSVDGGIIIDSGTYQLDTAFTEAMSGGILIENTHQFDTAFTSTQSAGVDIDSGTYNISPTFTSTQSSSVLRTSEYPDIAINFTSTQDTQLFVGVPNINLVHNLTETVVVTVIPGPIPYYTLLLDPASRTIEAFSNRTANTTTSNRTISVNESRNIAVNNESRLLKVR